MFDVQMTAKRARDICACCARCDANAEPAAILMHTRGPYLNTTKQPRDSVQPHDAKNEDDKKKKKKENGGAQEI